ncbi:MAG: hypothetical protein LBG22_04765, partial [Treponema sp.]|nr:hypothetical protein [Treponema sp.]
MDTRNYLYTPPPPPIGAVIHRAIRGFVFLFLLALPGCDNYNLSFKDFFSGGGLERGETDEGCAADTVQDDGEAADTAPDNGGGTDIPVPPAGPALTGIADIAAYLAAAPAPVSLAVALDLASEWQALLGAIAAAGKYVALDLSACTGVTEFDPGAADTGERYIVS